MNFTMAFLITMAEIGQVINVLINVLEANLKQSKVKLMIQCHVRTSTTMDVYLKSVVISKVGDSVNSHLIN